MKQTLQRGYTTLISVLTISAIGMAIVLTLIVLGSSAGESSFAEEQGAQARALAHGCVEIALDTIKSSSSYTGTTVVDPLGKGSCTYNVVDTGGNTRSIESRGVVGDVTQRVQTSLLNVAPIVVENWIEVASF